jgi:predicted exporter
VPVGQAAHQPQWPEVLAAVPAARAAHRQTKPSTTLEVAVAVAVVIHPPVLRAREEREASPALAAVDQAVSKVRSAVGTPEVLAATVI